MEPEPGTMENTTENINDVRILAMSFMSYKIGDALYRWYDMFMIPSGIIGNILSFLVMIQPHNRHMSFSVYICALAVADTVSLLLGLTVYLNTGFNVDMPPNQFWYCTLMITILSASTKWSSYLIIAMTFERFYGIIRPHKAASFNTVKKARNIITAIVLISIIYDIPHLFTTTNEGRTCVTYYKGMQYLAGRIYYYGDQVVSFGIPFVSLLVMNSVIIHTLRNRSKSMLTQGQGHDQGHDQSHDDGEGKNRKMKSSETQIIIMLLLITFAYLILMIPAYSMAFYASFVDYESSPRLFAGFHLINAVGNKTFFTNYAINFYLYVMSGQKFRSDVVELFRRMCPRKSADGIIVAMSSPNVKSVSSSQPT